MFAFAYQFQLVVKHCVFSRGFGWFSLVGWLVGGFLCFKLFYKDCSLSTFWKKAQNAFSILQKPQWVSSRQLEKRNEELQDGATQCPCHLTWDTMAICLLWLYRTQQVLLAILAVGNISCFPASEDSAPCPGKPGKSMWHRSSPQICRRYHMPKIGETQAKIAFDPGYMSELTLWELTEQKEPQANLNQPFSTPLLYHLLNLSTLQLD